MVLPQTHFPEMAELFKNLNGLLKTQLWWQMRDSLKRCSVLLGALYALNHRPLHDGVSP